MKAMIFAAGLGTRLRPLTDSRPKALVEVGGKAMIDRAISRLMAAGVDEIVVNVHHHASMLIDHIKSLKIPGVEFYISDERELLLDTGGGILKARKYLDGKDPFIVYNADILTDLDLGLMVKEHAGSQADATLLVSRRDTSRYLLLDNESMQMRGWTNVKTGEVKPAGLDASGLMKMAFGGIHVLSPSVFDYLEDYATRAVFSIMPFYIDHCNKMVIKVYEPAADYMWHDVGSIEKLKAAEADVRASQL